MQVRINDRWPLWLPPHRAEIPSWPIWEKERLASMYTAIRPGDLVVDVGAEQGDLSALYMSWGARVALMEPNPKVWPNIREVFHMNGLGPPVASWVGFAGQTDDRYRQDWGGGDVPFWGGWPKCSEGEPFPEGGFLHLDERTDCPIIALDSFYDEMREQGAIPGSGLSGGEPRVDVVTIDIEGAELRCLLGAEKMLTGDRPILFVSVHPEFMYDRYRDTPDDLFVHMRKMGYVETFLAQDHERHYMFKPLPQ